MTVDEATALANHRCECEECTAMSVLTAEVRRLRAIVAKLPVSADGVPLHLHMPVWFRDQSILQPGYIELLEIGMAVRVRIGSRWMLNTECYSTVAAAESARAEQAGGEP